jgi:hypothetical protein
MPDGDQQEIEKAIRAIQDIAIMLTGAPEYVCEARILKRCSADIEEKLNYLETYLSGLKKKFPGKFPETLNPDSSLSAIRKIAAKMKDGSSNIEAKCRAGELGNELSVGLTELRGVVRDIWDTLSGKVSGYNLADRILDQGAKLKSLLLGLSPLVSTTGKIILAVILVLLISFLYFCFTMESEDALLASIEEDLVYIETQKDSLQKHRSEYREIVSNINSLKIKELSREEKIQFLNLSTQEKKVKGLIDNLLFSIEKKEVEVAEKEKRLYELQKKSFFQKLLKI